jgi:hypothetical protein
METPNGDSEWILFPCNPGSSWIVACYECWPLHNIMSAGLDGEEQYSDRSSVGTKTVVLVGSLHTGADGALVKTVVLVGLRP